MIRAIATGFILFGMLLFISFILFAVTEMKIKDYEEADRGDNDKNITNNRG